MTVRLSHAIISQPLIAQIPWKTQHWTKRLQMSTVIMLSDLNSLRTTAAAAFSRDDIEPVLWAGVFDSFAVGKQNSDSDMDVVIIHSSDYHEYKLPFTAPLLEDLLSKAWGRKVDIIHLISGEEFRGYVCLESLLSSQTIYGSVENPSVAAVRR